MVAVCDDTEDPLFHSNVYTYLLRSKSVGRMRYVVLLSVAAGLSYLVWWLTPPQDVIGSCLSGFEGSERQMMMFRAEQEQRQNRGL